MPDPATISTTAPERHTPDWSRTYPEMKPPPVVVGGGGAGVGAVVSAQPRPSTTRSEPTGGELLWSFNMAYLPRRKDIAMFRRKYGLGCLRSTPVVERRLGQAPLHRLSTRVLCIPRSTGRRGGPAARRNCGISGRGWYTR